MFKKSVFLLSYIYCETKTPLIPLIYKNKNTNLGTLHTSYFGWKNEYHTIIFIKNYLISIYRWLIDWTKEKGLQVLYKWPLLVFTGNTQLMAEEAFNYLYYYFLNKIMLIHTFDFLCKLILMEIVPMTIYTHLIYL